MIFGKFVPDCVRSNLRGSKFKIFLGGKPLVGTHTTIILLSSCPPPPTQNPVWNPDILHCSWEKVCRLAMHKMWQQQWSRKVNIKTLTFTRSLQQSKNLVPHAGSINVPRPLLDFYLSSCGELISVHSCKTKSGSGLGAATIMLYEVNDTKAYRALTSDVSKKLALPHDFTFWCLDDSSAIQAWQFITSNCLLSTSHDKSWCSSPQPFICWSSESEKWTTATLSRW